MTYELAKELWDAGFPMPEYFYNASLSELIEACGDRFEFLERATDGWKCVGDWKPLYGDDYPIYETPETAVAKLWLELNKK